MNNEEREGFMKENKEFDFTKIDMYIKIINCLGFDINNKDIKIGKEMFDDNEGKVIEIINSKEFKNIFNQSFGIVKKNRFSISGFLENCGFKIQSCRNRVQKGKIKFQSYEYMLSEL